MSQDVTTKPKEREPSSGSTRIQPWSAEAEADKLMDELFGDIDRILEGSSRLPTEPIKPEYVSLKSIAFPQLTMPPAVIPPQELIEQPNPEPSEPQPSETVEKEVAPPASSRANQSSRTFEKLLLVAGIASVGVTLILLLKSQKKLTWPWSPKQAASPVVQKRQVSAVDAQFANYMLRSLEVIDTKTKAKQQTTPAPGTASTLNPPSMPAQSQQPLSQPSRVLERVYIPVYPPQTPVAPTVVPSVARPPVPTLSAPAPLPSAQRFVPAPLPRVQRFVPAPLPRVQRFVPAPLPSARRSAPAPSPAARRSAPAPSPAARRSAPAPSPATRRLAPAPSPAARRSAPAPSPAARRSAPAPSPAARRSVPASPQTAASAVIPVVPVMPPSAVVPTIPMSQSPTSASKHTLVGLMELDNGSVAMFDVGGAIQRIQVGEPIGDSGWTLVSVANQEAVIRRNGEVRSVYIGQTF